VHANNIRYCFVSHEKNVWRNFFFEWEKDMKALEAILSCNLTNYKESLSKIEITACQKNIEITAMS
jgi:hypothetical protein